VAVTVLFRGFATLGGWCSGRVIAEALAAVAAAVAGAHVRMLCKGSNGAIAALWYVVLLLSSTAFCTSAASAGSSDLNEVVITGHRLEESLPEQIAQYGGRLDTISSAEIQNGGYTDVAQTLQALSPGLYVQSKNEPFDYADISLLGSRTEDVLWLVDGVRINNRLYSGTPPTDTLPAAMIDHIEVLEGGQALYYGTSALAGAINIVTRPFSNTPSGSVSVGADTHWGRHIDASFADGFGRQQIVVFGSFDKSNGFRAFRPVDYQPSATDRDRGYDVWTLGGKYAFNVTDQLRLNASYQHTYAILDFASPFRVARDVNARKEDLATLKLDYELTDDIGFYVKSYYHRWHTSYDTIYNDLQTPGTQDVLYDGAFWGYNDYGVNALGQFKLATGVEAVLGYDLQIYGGRDEVLVIEQHDERTQAVFGQVRVNPDLLPRTHLAAGFRFNSPSVGAKATVWNVSGQYDVLPNLYFKTTFGTNFRLPSAEELFANDPQDERGNPHLKPERSKSINASLGGSVGNARFSWELVAFARNIDNLIDYGSFDDETGQDVFANVPGTVKVRGGEIALSAVLTPSLSTHASFEANRSKQDGGAQLLRVPQQVGKAELDFHPDTLPLGATLAMSYTGNVATSVGDDLVPYGHYIVFDLSGRYYIDSARKQRISVSLQNVFDRQYGRPGRGCLDTAADGPYDCSAPYTYVNRGLPRTATFRYIYSF
jgi:outer membrane cobalamin receptor